VGTIKNIFEVDKIKLEVMLDEINADRVDAHAKSVDNDHFTQLRLHFNKLETILKDWV